MRNRRFILFALVYMAIFAGIWYLTATASQEQNVHFGGNEWPRQVLAFYKSAASAALQNATGTGARRIRLIEEAFSGDYVCSSPCNEGLAASISNVDPVTSRLAALTVVYDRQPLTLTPLAHWVSPHIASNTGLHVAGDPKAIVSEDPGDLVLQIHVDDIELGAGTYRARFSLWRVSGTPAALVPPILVSGPDTELNWFVRRKTPPWIMSSIFGALIVFFVVLILVAIAGRFAPNSGALDERISLYCTGIGIVYAAMLVLFPIFDRRAVSFYDRPGQVVLLLDTNSEIWLNPDNKEKVGPPQFAVLVEQDLNEWKKGKKAARLPSFGEWLVQFRSNLLPDIFSPKQYPLNTAWEVESFKISGADVPPSSPALWKKITSLEREARTGDPVAENLSEGRLVDPRREIALQPSVENVNVPVRIIILLSSASAMTPRNCDDFLHQLQSSGAPGLMAGGPRTTVLSVAVPALPSTGDPAISFVYEEYRLALLAEVSDWVLPLNAAAGSDARGRNLVATAAADLKLPGVSSIADKITPMSHPLYKFSNLSLASAREWDMPTDLTASSRNALAAAPGDAKASAQEVTDKVEQIADPLTKSMIGDYQIHVIGSMPIATSILLIAITCWFGFRAFVTQWGTRYFHDHLERRHQLKYHLGEFTAFLAFVLLLLRMIWLSSNPSLATSFGRPSWILIGSIFCWIACVNPSKLYAIRRFVHGRPSSRAVLFAFLLCAVPIAVFLIIYLWVDPAAHWQTQGAQFQPLFQNSSFWTALVLILLPLIIYGIQYLLSIGTDPSYDLQMQPPGADEFWRRTDFSLLCKILLIGGLALLLRGALPATPSSVWPRLLSYHGLICGVAIAWTWLGVCLGSFSARGAPQEWAESKVASMLKLAPLMVSAMVSILLIILLNRV